MMTRAKIFTIVWFFMVICLCNCSGSPNGVVKPIDDDSTNGGILRDEGAIPPPQTPLPSIIDFTFHNFIEIPVEMFYYYNGRVPSNFQELKSSGLLMAIPVCGINDSFYHEVQEISFSDPAGFVYSSTSDKAYACNYVGQENGNYTNVTINYDENTWNEKLLRKTGDYLDAKLQALMEFFPGVLYVYYRKHGELPANAEAMFEDYNLVEEGWTTPEGLDNKAYYEFGIDQSHNRFYGRYKYTFGFKKCLAQDLNLWAPEFYPVEDPILFLRFFSFDETPPSDYLIFNPWFKMDSLSEAYDLLMP